jgi:hypothetical protein
MSNFGALRMLDDYSFYMDYFKGLLINLLEKRIDKKKRIK